MTRPDVTDRAALRAARGGDDDAAIAALITRAFADAPHAGGNEARIVDLLRAQGALLWSGVAEHAGSGEIVGHVAFSPAELSSGGKWCALGPLSVCPAWQRRGIGGRLLRQGCAQMRAMGFDGVILLGDPDYYRRFDFAPAPGLSWNGAGSPYLQHLSFCGQVPQGSLSFHKAFAEA